MSDMALPDETYLGSARLEKFTNACLIIYILIYCLESPVRYGLYLVHASSFIVARDLLIDIPVCLCFALQVLRGKLQVAFTLFVLLVIVQGSIFLLNYGASAFLTFLFGLKLIITGQLGLVAGRGLIQPSQRTRRMFIGLLVISIAALVIEKLGGNFPWVGLHDQIGGADIVLSRDWEVSDPLFRRVGGFFRLSIAAAFGISVIGITVASGIRRPALRFATLLASVCAVALTTQKGAISALFLVMLAMLMPIRLRLAGLRTLVIIGVFFNATASFFTYGMDIRTGGGSVASATSFAWRVKLTWPQSWEWITQHGVFPFGVGIGGMGAPLRIMDPVAAAFPDNMFIFMYAYFGLFAVLMYLAFAYAAWRSIKMSPADAEPALAILAFLMLYGIVVSIIEDQIGMLYLGVSMGWLMTKAVPLIGQQKAGASLSRQVSTA